MISLAFGILNINKPVGMTSRRVVDRVVKLIHPAKVGHAGTLDPLASGVLVLCIGPATRLIGMVQQQTKAYRAHFLLGMKSNTDDLEGEIIDVPGRPIVTREQIEQALPRFLGTIEQIPPQFSAVHVDGKRAYALARQGEVVDIQPRPVEIHRLSLVEFSYPELALDIECGSGTYIRSLGRDLGERLGCGAVMSKLIRTRIGPYSLDSASELETLSADSLPSLLRPAMSAVDHLPHYRCKTADLDEIRHGRLLQLSGPSKFSDDATVAVCGPEGELTCLAHYRSADNSLAPKQVFLDQK